MLGSGTTVWFRKTLEFGSVKGLGFWASIDGVTNAYDGHTTDAGLAKDAGCDVADGQADWNAGQEKASINAGYSYHVYGLSLALICK